MKLDADYWVTREGNKVYPKDMTDEHLINTIRYLHENVDGIALCYRPFPSFPSFGGDDTIYYASQSFEREINKTNLEWLKERRIYKLLMAEAERRGISLT